MKRIAPEHTHEQVVQAEVAHELLNKAGSIILAEMRSVKATDPDRAARLLDKAAELQQLQRSFGVTDDAIIAEIIATWGERIKDRAGFIRSL